MSSKRNPLPSPHAISMRAPNVIPSLLYAIPVLFSIIPELLFVIPELLFVIPAKAGIHLLRPRKKIDPRLRGDDVRVECGDDVVLVGREDGKWLQEKMSKSYTHHHLCAPSSHSHTPSSHPCASSRAVLRPFSRRAAPLSVIPAKAGIHLLRPRKKIDHRLRGDDVRVRRGDDVKVRCWDDVRLALGVWISIEFKQKV